MSLTLALQWTLGAFALLDVVIFYTTQTDPARIIESMPHAGVSDEQYTRLFGMFFLLCGIARAHGAMNLTEKGAYRVAIWSFIIEMLQVGLEIQRGALDLEKHKLMHIFVLCGSMVLWMTLMYKSILYPVCKTRKD